ncbi:helix-turn-helix domain-containing protein [Leisingera sp. S232]|uniref:helix-turn-helix domain-containing protein n=1 Tax=Leisingera sp. S232 TaxID=3415132 RepID=UPI00086E1140|nr:hypothetical protein AB838_08515 [Rhodobacteraceae bacterium (ex Bugula neritina AB1)]
MPNDKAGEIPPHQNTQRICREIKALRKAKRLTLRQLGERCGRTAGYLSQVENGTVVPSIDSISRIAEALGVETNWFFPATTGASDAEAAIVVRNQGRRRISHSYSFDTQELGYQDFLLSADLTLDLIMGMTRLEPGGKSRGVPTKGQGHFCGFVKTGRVNLTVGQEQFVLGEEDSFSFDMTIAHDFANAHDDVTEVVWTVTPAHLDF